MQAPSGMAVWLLLLLLLLLSSSTSDGLVLHRPTARAPRCRSRSLRLPTMSIFQPGLDMPPAILSRSYAPPEAFEPSFDGNCYDPSALAASYKDSEATKYWATVPPSQSFIDVRLVLITATLRLSPHAALVSHRYLFLCLHTIPCAHLDLEVCAARWHCR